MTKSSKSDQSSAEDKAIPAKSSEESYITREYCRSNELRFVGLERNILLKPEFTMFFEEMRIPSKSSILMVNWIEISTINFFLQRECQINIIQNDEKAIYETSTIFSGKADLSFNANDDMEPDQNASNSTPYDYILVWNSIKDNDQDSLALLSRIESYVKKGAILVEHSKDSPNGLLTTLFDSNQFSRECFLIFKQSENIKLFFRERFLLDQPSAWRHFSSLIDEKGNERNKLTRPNTCVWQCFERNHDYPYRKNYQLTVSHAESVKTSDILKADFISISIDSRKPRYWTKTIKTFQENNILRKQINWSSTKNDYDENKQDYFFSHSIGREDYLNGPNLADQFLEILESHDYESKVQQFLNEYYLFLKQKIDDSSSVPIDLLLDNIVIDTDGLFKAIDQEWITQRLNFSADLAFYRGIVYFVARNSSIIELLNTSQRLGHSYEEFVNSCVTIVGINNDGLKAELVEFEEKLRLQTQRNFAVIDINSMLNRYLIPQDNILVKINLICSKSENKNMKDIFLQLSTVKTSCGIDLMFSDLKNEGQPYAIAIEIPEIYGQVCIHHLVVHNINGLKRNEIVNVHGIEAVKQVTTNNRDEARELDQNHSGLFSKRGQLAIHIPFPESEASNDLRVQIGISLPDVPYSLNDAKNVLRECRDSKITILEKKQENQIITEQLAKKEVEINSLKNSKAWRLAEFVRKIIYCFGSSEKNTKSTRPAIEILQKPEERPKELAGHLSANLCKKTIPKKEDKSNVRFSIVVPIHNTPREWLLDVVNSVLSQTYKNYQLILINDGSTKIETREVLDKLDNPQIDIFNLTSSTGISGATKMGIDASNGEYIAFMDHDDMLDPEALEIIAEKVFEANPDVIYTDEASFRDDTLPVKGKPFGVPHCKPDFSPDLLLSHNYITHLLVVRKSLLDLVDAPESQYDGAQDYDLLLKISEKTKNIVHIPKALYYWRQSVQSTSLDTGAKPDAHNRGKKAIEECLKRRAINAEVLNANAPHFFRVKRYTEKQSISIIIPFRDKPELLHKCLSALLDRTRYSNFNIIGIDNQSELELTKHVKNEFESQHDIISFHSYDRPFNFSSIVNFGVTISKSEHVVLMNNDIEVINNDWLEAMLEHSQRPEIGAVGGKLFYPDDTIQHAGIIIGIGGYAGHSHKGKSGGDHGYLNRLNLIQNVSAVTGALLMCQKSVYESIDGFNAVDFGVACNDVDFCLRLTYEGFRNIFTPYAMAYHGESLSRGYEDTDAKKERFQNELNRFKQLHSRILENGDPYYNPNLRLDVEDFRLRNPTIDNIMPGTEVS